METEKKAPEELHQQIREVVKRVAEHWRSKTAAAFVEATPQEQQQLYLDLYDMALAKMGYFMLIMNMLSGLRNLSPINQLMLNDFEYVGCVVAGLSFSKDNVGFIEKQFNELWKRYPELKPNVE